MARDDTPRKHVTTPVTAAAIERGGETPPADLAAMATSLLAEIAADEDAHWGGGRISPSAYEAAWVALVRHPEDPQRLAFPAALDWLLRHQRSDGGWDPPFPHGVIPTMAALLALQRAPVAAETVGDAVARGVLYLRRMLLEWRADLVDTPFFEFLIPALAVELERENIALAIPDLDLMLARRDAKLALLPLEALYAGQSSLLHALEVFGPTLDYRRLRDLRAPNGGYGCSPSATAAVLLNAPEWDEGAAVWLRHLEVVSEQVGDPGAMATSHPADVFEAAWTLHLLRLGGLATYPRVAEAAGRVVMWLRDALTPEGASFSRLHGLPCDADDTALALAVLNDSGLPTDLASLWNFERDAHFASYKGERTASTSTNAHVLDALLSVSAAPVPALADRVRKVARYLLAEGHPEGYWEDKWHISPYYATLSCALALARLPETPEVPMQPRFQATLAWLAHTQHRDGGWGAREVTIEETAYGLLTAASLLRLMPRLSTLEYRSMVGMARSYLHRHLYDLTNPESVASLPALWVDKTLYAPPRVIRAALLAALHCPIDA
jgi:halimadienyl-diphosphate synthase